jgi:hypothetical protein
MYVKLNARGQIVEATDATQGNEYTEVAGRVATNMPAGLLGFNGTVQTPNYALVDGAVVARADEDKARDPYSDEPVTEDYETAYNIVTGVTE